MDEDVKKMIEVLKALDEAYPFKRVRVPKHLLDRYNEEFGGEVVVKEMAFTFAKGTEVSEDEIWDFMLKMREIAKTAKPVEFGPPVTGLPKRTLH